VINGSGSTAILSSAGLMAGKIMVNCIVTDSLQHTATQSTSVMIVAAPVQAAVTTSALCSVSFARDVLRTTRVDNEAKACLDDVALNLQRNPEAKLMLVGATLGTERNSNHVAAQRAVNTKAYLVSDKGIDASRVAAYTGKGDGKTVSIILVPTGATVDASGDALVDETKVTVQPRSSRRRR
jgi:hypothetical protein